MTCRRTELRNHVDGLTAMAAGKALKDETVFNAFVHLYDWASTKGILDKLGFELNKGDMGESIQLDGSVADEVLAARRFLLRRVISSVKQGVS